MRLGLLLSSILLCAAPPGVPVEVTGGTVAALPAGSNGRMQLTGSDALLFESTRHAALRIPYAKVHTLEYGQRVHRRYAEGIVISPVLLLSKSRKHFVTIGYTDED